MNRNLHNRVETIFPILDLRLQRKLLRILATELHVDIDVWELQPDGSYVPVQSPPGEAVIRSQDAFMQDSAGFDVDLP